MNNLPATCKKLVSCLLITLLATGCVSVRTTGRQSASGQGGGIEVTVFPDDAARKAGQPGPREVASELARREDGQWIPIYKSLSPRWSVTDLPPGKYRVHFTSILDDSGNPQPLDSRPKTLRVTAGQVTQVETTLEHVSKGWIVVGVLTAVVAAVLLADALDDLPIPDPPSPELVELVAAATHVTLELAFIEEWSDEEGPVGRPPVVTSHFPEDGAMVAARRLRVVFAVSEPIVAQALDDQVITVTAENAGPLSGTVSYDAENWWIVWEPADDLPREDIVHVTLDGRALTDFHGNLSPEDVTFTFQTTP